MKKIQTIISYIEKAPKIAFFHHVNPDGDSLSCSYGLLLALKQKFPDKKIVMVGDKEGIKKTWPFLKINDDFFIDKIDNTYLSIIGDTSVSNRIEKYDEFKKAKKTICFDHHQNENDIEYDIFWKESNYPASSMQAFEIVKNLDIKLNETSSLFLLIGLLTDTGNFTFSLANPLPPLYYSQLLENISNETMNQFFNNFKKRTKEDIKIQKEILNSIKFKDKVAYVVFNKNKLKKFPEIENKQWINLIGNIESYPIWAFFIHHVDKDRKKSWKLHLRSNGPKVSQVAIEFGGGGHYRAAGAKINKKIKIKDIIKKLNQLI